MAMQSMAPERSASISAVRSSCDRSGGFILKLASSERTASSVRQRWCGVTSLVIWTPAAFASSIAVTDSLAETCWMWIRPSSYAAMAASRAMAVDSETDGRPASPSSAETAPSCITPVPDRERSSS